MCNYSKGLNFKICLRAQKATGQFRAQNVDGTFEKGLYVVPPLSVAQRLTKGGGGGGGFG